MMVSDVTPSACAAKFGAIRCRSTGFATAMTSSTDAWKLPCRIARAFAALISASWAKEIWELFLSQGVLFGLG